MANVADSVYAACEARLRRLHDTARLQVVHQERAFLSTLDFTEEQLRKFDERVSGVAERLERVTGKSAS